MKPPANLDFPIQSDASSQGPSALDEYQDGENEFQARVDGEYFLVIEKMAFSK